MLEIGGATTDRARRASPALSLVHPLRRETSAHSTVRRSIALVLLVAALDAAAVSVATFGVSRSVPLVVGTTPVWIGVVCAYGLYARRRLLLSAAEVRKLLHAVTVGVAYSAMFASVLGVVPGRYWFAQLWLASAALLGVSRVVSSRATAFLQHRGWVSAGVLIVGTNDEAQTISRVLARHRWAGYRPVGFVATESDAQCDDLRVYGSVDRIAEAVEASGARSVVVASTALDPGRLPGLTAALQSLGVDIHISAGLPDVAASRVTVEPLDGLAMLAVRRNELLPHQAFGKRALDVVGSVVLGVACLPLLLVIALLIRVTSGGPVLFRQVRVGEGGRSFVIYKFRTMVADAPVLLDTLSLRALNEADGLLFKVREDPRVTRLGRVLRRLGLDELPQLYNVLRGEMSLVGPRPPLPDEAARYDEWVKGRLRVKPGITGLWQVNGRHELSFADYVRYDLFYVENWTFALDLLVLAKTLPALLSRRGAY